MSDLRSDLIKVAEAYGQGAGGLALSTVSTRHLGSGAILPRIAAGACDITVGKCEGAILAMARDWPTDADWPEGVAWPESVPRPAIEEPSAGA